MAYRDENIGGIYRVGYFDGRLSEAESLPDYDEHYSDCFDARARTGHLLPRFDENLDRIERIIRFATVDTHYTTLYRICDRNYLTTGADFYLNWEDSTRKRKKIDRFSPPGLVGHYFGCTFDASMSETLHYSAKPLNEETKFVLLVLECYLQNILYLSDYQVLMAVCEMIGHQYKCPLELMMELIGPDTSNPLAEKIGRWARSRGLEGLVYPTVRFDQMQDLKRATTNGQPRYPMINSVSLACRMDFGGWGIQSSLYHRLMEEKWSGDCHSWVPIYADLNIVLFSGKQLQGEDRAIFWQSCPLEMAEHLVKQDERPTVETSHIWFDKDGKNPSQKWRQLKGEP